jgi:topoisomerase-4 subunit A
MKVFKVSDKTFVGKDIIHIAIFKKNDERMIYNMIYRDGPTGITFMKRFPVTGVTRDKEYDLTKGTPGSYVFWFTVNPNGESEKVIVHLRQVAGLRKTELPVDFAELEVKARTAVGNIVTKYTVNKVSLKEKGVSTLEGEDLWFDEATHRLSKDEKGSYLGKFGGDDKILTLTSKGIYKLYSYDLLNHFDEDIVLIEKYFPNLTLTCIYYDGQSKSYFTKRFEPEVTTTKTLLITEHELSRVELVTTQINPVVEVKFAKEKGQDIADEVLKMVNFSPMVNMRAKGKKLSSYKVKEINLREPEEIKAAKKFLSADDEKTGLSPMELHRRAMEKLNKDNAKDFLDGDGQITFDF